LNKVNYSYTKRSPDCDCSSGFPSCPLGASGDISYRNVFELKTFDHLYDLTGRNITEWLIKTEFEEEFFRKRYGGFEFMPNEESLQSQPTSKNLLNNLNEFTEKLTLVLSHLNNVTRLDANKISIKSSNATVNLSSATLEYLLNQINLNEQLIDSNELLANKRIRIWYNPKGFVSSVAYLNLINNAILRSRQLGHLENISSTSSDLGIVAYNHPMSYTREQLLNELQERLIFELFVTMCIIFALSFIPASFLVFLLEERESNCKQLQFVSGVRPYIYWTSNFIWDLFNYLIPCTLCILMFVLFNVPAYTSPANFSYMICLMFLYGWASIPLMYPLNYIFKMPSTAFVICSCLNVIIGVTTTMVTSILVQLADQEPDLARANEILKPIFTILFPHYCLGQGFIEMSYLHLLSQAKQELGNTAVDADADLSPYEFNTGGRNLVALFFQGIFYFVLNMLIQYKFFLNYLLACSQKSSAATANTNGNTQLDEDVLNEKKRLASKQQKQLKIKYKSRLGLIGSKLKKSSICDDFDFDADTVVESDSDIIKLINLSKSYKKFEMCGLSSHVTVNDLCLGINKGECFGLIGVNGAGNS
jgi:ATP-binding cassette, subfamily A (ABC1), member 1